MSVSDNLARVREGIDAACRRSGRTTESVSLMAVSKFHPAESVLEAIGAGLALFGENRVQEALGKFPAILEAHPQARVHLIGSLQRNKAGSAVGLFSCVQSVDRAELLEELGRQAEKRGTELDILFEFHTGEDSKAGYPDRDSLYRSLDLLDAYPRLRCRGLMTMAPFTQDKDLVRASFRALAALRRDCQARYPSLDFTTLSMGMSSDYELAIEEGSTLVRIGTAIFGERT